MSSHDSFTETVSPLSNADRSVAPHPKRTGLEQGRRRKEASIQIQLFIWALAVVGPLLFVVSVSLKTQGQWVSDPLLLIPDPVTFENFGKFLDAVDLPRMMGNTLTIVLFSVVGTTVSCAIVAYPLARLRFKGRGAVTVLVLATMMLPAQVLLIPQYVLFVKLHWIDTFYPLIIPTFFAVNAFMVFFLRQAFRMIPRELEDAVLIDGGTHWTAFTRVILPLSKTPLIIVVVLQGVATYNDYFYPLIYLHSPDKQTMAIGVPLSGASVPGVSSAPVVMMGTLIFVVPIAIAFALGQRWLAKGVSLAGSINR